MSGKIKNAASATALLAAAAVVLCVATGARGVSVDDERQLGRNFALAARAQLPFLDDPFVVGYVNDIGQRIAVSLQDSFFEYHFSVVRESSINAFAVPGGYVYLNSGLLARVENDDELAAVIGHEVAHVHAHHLARQQQATQLLNYATLLGALLSVFQPAIGAVATAANSAVQLQYSREFEQEADYMGTRYMRTAGYQSRGMLDFLQKLKDDQRLMPDSIPPYLLSHPLTDARLNHLEAVLKTQGLAGKPRGRKSFTLKRVQVLTRAQSEPPGDVVAAYRAAVEADPGDAEARYLFGLACLETGQFGAAEAALGTARAAGITAADADLGRLALRSRQPEKARVLLEAALASDPRDAGTHADLAKALEVLGEPQLAMQEYRRAIELAPELATAHRSLAMLEGRTGENADAFYHLATSMRLQGSYAEALNQYKRAAPLLPAGNPRRDEVRGAIEELSDFLHVTRPKEGAGKRAK